ncbi:CoA transferase [Halomonas sp. McH1-25]|uniref:CaiB/BaiF CoA transferase family protein n=1 Tax=unclassified Halomonas TaxID=2609666 RepID=UPI001EF407BB|nr:MULTISPECIES: CoA transferase [unclassified Halomonas]MCG7602207.1 CoA transferase [Halomonas sp. McH1-25]MCP1344464.1 CoA transferase [Halomonas sp. FL8]MCP1362785.1 CoA transferase [Halomonas sp. BBD45]MCP1363706.1 CoA transferase [Halomonas sp. BBD48]
MEKVNHTQLPLEGVKVLDLARLVAGGFLSTIMADFGAEVVKVEQPGSGDPLRAWSPANSQLWWKVYARNKKSMTLDLSREEGRKILLELVPHFDVLTESFVPGKLESWGIGPNELHKVNPNLIIVRASGWGQTGAYHKRPGFGTLIEAMSGFADMTGFPDRPPTLPPLPLADMVTALYGATATMIALFDQLRRDDGGQVIDLAIYEPLVSILGPMAAEYQHFGVKQKRRGNRAPTNAPRNIYFTSDEKWVAISAATQSMCNKFFRSLGLEALIEDPRFITNHDRIQNVEALDDLVQAVIGNKTQEENLETFYAAGVTAAPVYDIEQLLADDHVRTREVIVDAEDDDWTQVKMHNVIPRLSKTPGRIGHTGPKLGEHTEAVLAASGFSADRIVQIRADGLFGQDRE